MKTNEERLEEILTYLDSLSHIHSEEIPDIPLYMDQVTTFMDEHLKDVKRHQEDKVLTKTMINNYAKNNLLPPPEKKKYSKNHMLMLIFIYYFKNLLSFSDIEEIFRPITERHFSGDDSGLKLEDIYNEVFTLEEEQMAHLKEDIRQKYEKASRTFSTHPVGGEDLEYLRLFSLICELSFDVYLKKQMIEMIADELRSERPQENRRKKR